jgi:GT2 family glycosyltransferase
MVSIIVVNYKNPALLRLSLKSIKRSIGSDFDYEIVVVDVVSSVETRNVVREEFENIKLLKYVTNIGYTKAVNAGLSAADGDFIIIFNPDIIPLDGSIEKLTEYLKLNPQIGLVGPQLLNFDGSRQDSCFGFYTPLTVLSRRSFIGNLPNLKKIINKYLLRDKDLTKPLAVDWLMGSAYMTSKQALKRVGPLDEKFFMYMSDVDWARRFWENGYSVVYCPLAKMYHYHQRASKGRWAFLDILVNRFARWHIKDAIKYFRKYGTRKPEFTAHQPV